VKVPSKKEELEDSSDKVLSLHDIKKVQVLSLDTNQKLKITLTRLQDKTSLSSVEIDLGEYITNPAKFIHQFHDEEMVLTDSAGKGKATLEMKMRFKLKKPKDVKPAAAGGEEEKKGGPSRDPSPSKSPSKPTRDSSPPKPATQKPSSSQQQ
jgi:hypothetical protein